jgi:hypothetical protein
MTQIDKEAVERLANELDNLGESEAFEMLHALRAALDIAEAEKRAAVAAAYKKAARAIDCRCIDCCAIYPAKCPKQLAHTIRALSDTDALAEYAEKVRAEAYKEGWRFAYTQWERTGSVPDPEYVPHSVAIREDK